MLSLAEHLLEIQVTDLTLGNKISGQHFKAKQYFLGLFHFLRSGSMCWMCYVVISHGPVLHSVQCTVSSHPCALHCITLTCAGAVVAVVLHAVAGRLDGPGKGLASGP